MKLKIIIILISLVLLAFFALFSNTGVGLIELISNWKQDDPPIPSRNEVVMPADSTIQATTKTGTIIIRAKKGLRRYYSFDGITRYVVMIPRPERWYGSLGLYYPGPGFHWLPSHNGISRGVLEEGQRHFDSMEEAMKWLKEASQWYPTVYRDDGLVVAYGKNLTRKQLNVDVWQVYINGQKPTKMEGSNNEAIRTSWDKKP
jgi:hypothetical protein